MSRRGCARTISRALARGVQPRHDRRDRRPDVRPDRDRARQSGGRIQPRRRGPCHRQYRIDALLWARDRVERDAALRAALDVKYGFLGAGKKLVLVTGHRRESFGEGFKSICDALLRLSANGDLVVLYPVHLNPNVRGVVGELLGAAPNVHLVEPVEYLEMVYLMQRAWLILTDSGGMQEEGPALGRPVLVMRDVTERPEAIETGVVKLVGTDSGVITAEVDRLWRDEAAYRAMARPVFPYGDGTAGLRIAQILERKFAQ